jgi:hypothetical protein
MAEETGLTCVLLLGAPTLRSSLIALNECA